jgi:hypothetical protein
MKQQQISVVAPTDTPPLDDWFTVDDLAATFPKILTVPALRWQLRHRDTNGLNASGAVRRCGKKMLISKSRFERWLASSR